MAHLTLNGVDVKTRRGGQVKRQRIGKMSRALDGSVLEEIRARKRAWRFTGEILSQTDFEKVRKLIEGRGDGWNFDGDGYSHKGVGPDSNEQATYLAEAADGLPIDTDWKYGQSVFISGAAVNLCTENVRTGTDSGGDITGFEAHGTTVTSSTDAKWQGSKSLKVVWDGVGADDFDLDDIAVNQLTDYTLSFYARGAGTGGAEIQNDYDIELDPDVGATVSKTTKFKAGVWQRYEVRISTIALAAVLVVRIVDNDNALGATIYFDGFQLEANDIATAWVDGTRAAADDLAYDATQLPDLSGDLTVMFWVGAASRVGWTNAFGGLFSLHDGTSGAPTEGLEIVINGPDGKTYATVRANGSGTLEVISSSLISVDDATGPILRTPRHVTVIVRAASSPKLEIFIDGSSEDTDDTGDLWDTSEITVLEVGSWREGFNHLDGWIDDLTILPYALTAAEVASVYALGVANLSLPELLMEGDVIPESSLTVLGHALSDRPSPVSIDGTWHNNAARLEFELLEV